jgi:hypothetical protein
MNQPGRNPRPPVNTAAKRAYEISEVRLASNSHTMKGSRKNSSMPLTRCRIDTIAITG